MQLWNHFLMQRKVLSMAQIHQACRDIALEYGAFIIKQNLRRNFLLHLLNLVDHCLLKASKVPDIMVLVDKAQVNHYSILSKEFFDLLGVRFTRFHWSRRRAKHPEGHYQQFDEL